MPGPDHPAAWTTYAEQLYHHQFGFPLWSPDPVRSEWEVEIGDVGHLVGGEFMHLVRTTTPDEGHQPNMMLPDGFVPFNLLSTDIRGPRVDITQPVLHSRTIESSGCDLSASAGLPTGCPAASVNIEFRSAKDKWALLALSPNGEATSILPERKIIKYMLEHFESWWKLANDGLQRVVDEQDIYFVSGVVKTSHWSVAAFCGSQKGVQARISLDVGRFGSTGIKTDFSRIYTPGVSYKSGPQYTRRNVQNSLTDFASAQAAPSLPRTMTWARADPENLPVPATPQASPERGSEYERGANQCLFIHYYKMKHRRALLGLRLEAGARPHELPRSSDDPCASSGVLADDGSSIDFPELDLEMVSSVSKPEFSDPVNAALDYILENSTAKVAIASDMTLYALFKDQNFPSDVAADLARLRPSVEVDDSGVGMLVLDELPIAFTRPPSPIKSVHADISEPPFFNEESTLSELPFFNEDRVDDILLPPRPQSVCSTCWEGPFAMHFGLPYVPSLDGQRYRRRPQQISYSCSLAEMESRAHAGCVWCRFVLPKARDKQDCGRLTVTVRGTAKLNTPSWDPEHQRARVNVEVNGHKCFEGYMHTAADDPAASYITTRSPILDVGSPHTLALARQHVNECVDKHPRCRVPSLSSRSPTRLVDCTDLDQPRLVSTVGEHDEYLALSYVWGEDQIHKTTKSNISAYEQGITLSLLPATIRDAIYVTHALGFRLLWVDSLCILQDSDEDKLHEIGRMHHIYRYAHLTIIAGGADRVSDGFLHRRPPQDDIYDVSLPFICPPHHTAPLESRDHRLIARPRIGKVHFASSHSATSSPSNHLGCMATRAWCMQEYLLSPRALIFTTKALIFRCLTVTEGVGDILCDDIYTEPRIVPESLFVPQSEPAEPCSKEWNDALTAWMAVVEDYTGRKANIPSDKLVACAAVAEQFHRLLGSDYLAGLWRSDALLTHLLWSADTQKAKSLENSHIRPPTYRAPSWSWAAIDGAVHYGLTLNSLGFEVPRAETVALAEIVECWVTLENAGIPFGRVTDGVLVLRGTPIPCHGGSTESVGDNQWCVPLPSLEQARRLQWGLGRLSLDEEDKAHPEKTRDCVAIVTMDCDADALPGRMWVIPFVRLRRDRGGSTDQLSGIVVELAPPSSSSGFKTEKVHFRRVGFFAALVEGTRLGGPHLTENLLWDPLTQAVKDGESPWMDIAIV